MPHVHDESDWPKSGRQETKTERELRLFWVRVPLTLIGVCGVFLAEAITEYSLIGYFFSKDVFAPLILLLIAVLVVFVLMEMLKRLKSLTAARRKR